MKKKLRKDIKSICINLFVIFIVLLIVLYFSLKDNYEQIITNICNMNVIYFLLAIIFLLLYRVLIGFTSYNVCKLNKEKISLKKMIQINFIIPFFHGITPFAGGGQAMEIYYLHKADISTEKSVNITLQNFIVYQTALVFICIFAIIYNQVFNLLPSDSFMRKLVVFGFVVNIVILVASFIISFGKKGNKFIINKVIKFLSKIRIIKDRENAINKFNNYINKFHENAMILTRKKGKFLVLILINVLALSLYYAISYVVCLGIGINSVSIISCVVITTYVTMIGSFIPIPGAVGGLEYGFMKFFGYYIIGGSLTAIMLVWRFISYYLAMIIGALVLLFYRKEEKVCE